MKYTLINLLLSGLLIFCSCSSNDKAIIRTRLPDGRYISVPYIIKNGDTILIGIGKYYSDKKELIDEYEFRNSKRTGWHYHYDSGKLFSKIWIINDSANGEGLFYNKEGKVIRENHYYNDKLLLSKFFSQMGGVDLINFYDNELPYFAIKYDNTGKKISESGYVFARHFFSNQNIGSIKLGKPLELKIPIVSLPGHLTNIQIAKFSTKEEVYDVMDSVPIKVFFAIYNTSFSEIGEQMLGIAGELKNMDGKIIKRDTLYQKVNVVK